MRSISFAIPIVSSLLNKPRNIFNMFRPAINQSSFCIHFLYITNDVHMQECCFNSTVYVYYGTNDFYSLFDMQNEIFLWLNNQPDLSKIPWKLYNENFALMLHIALTLNIFAWSINICCVHTCDKKICFF